MSAVEASSRLYGVDIVSEATGATYRQLDHWERRGILVATRPARGSVPRRLYSVEDMVRAAAIVALCDMGVLPEMAATIVGPSDSLSIVAHTVGAIHLRVDLDAIRARVLHMLAIRERVAAGLGR